MESGGGRRRLVHHGEPVPGDARGASERRSCSGARTIAWPGVRESDHLTWNHPWRSRPGIWRQDLVLPTGWMKSYPRARDAADRAGRRAVARSLKDPDRPTALVITYPYYLHLARQLRPERLDLLQHRRLPALLAEVGRPGRAARTRGGSSRRPDRLHLALREPRNSGPDRRVVPRRSATCPTGPPRPRSPTNRSTCPLRGQPTSSHLPRPWIGYVGTLEDRVDWRSARRGRAGQPDGLDHPDRQARAGRRRALAGGAAPLPGSRQRPRRRLARSAVIDCIQSVVRSRA